MYPYKYYRYIDLPKLPENILKNINRNFHEYEKKDNVRNAISYQVYTWSDSFNEEINQWCQENICSSMYWGFQIINGDIPVHRDMNTLTKFTYILDSGGPEVFTEWYDEDQSTVIDSVVLETHRWHILKVDAFHSVRGVQPGMKRFSITGRIF